MKDLRLTQQEMLQIVKAQLATDYNCSPSAFEQEGFTFSFERKNPGYRPFSRSENYFEMATMGKGVVVSAVPHLLPFLQRELEGKSRDEAFSMPFVYQQGLYFLPSLERLSPIPLPEGFQLIWAEGEDIHSYYQLEGFHNAIQYNKNHPRPDVLAAVALRDGQVAGIAGASADCCAMWQIGIDVLPPWRGNHLAAALVSRMTHEILKRGIVPYYGTAISNIASQRTALRAGYQITWISTYQTSYPREK